MKVCRARHLLPLALARNPVTSRLFHGPCGCRGSILMKVCGEGLLAGEIARTAAIISMANEQDELVALLDPKRDYGDRTYADVVEQVTLGTLALEPGRTLPIIRDATTHRAVRGTGQPAIPRDADLSRWGRRRFNERAAEDFDEVYDAVVASAKAGDVRAQKLFVETYLGRPREIGAPDEDRAFQLLLTMATQCHAAGVSERYIDLV
jgi:hypothetical protein